VNEQVNEISNLMAGLVCACKKLLTDWLCCCLDCHCGTVPLILLVIWRNWLLLKLEHDQIRSSSRNGQDRFTFSQLSYWC